MPGVLDRMEMIERRCADILNKLADRLNDLLKLPKNLHSILGNALRIEAECGTILQESEGLALVKSEVSRLVLWNEYQASENHREIVRSLERFDMGLTNIGMATIVTKCNLKPIAEQLVVEAKIDDLEEQTETIMALLDERADAAVRRSNSTMILQQGKLIIAQLKQLHQAQRRQFRLTQSSNAVRLKAGEAPVCHIGAHPPEPLLSPRQRRWRRRFG
jgi:hypothetical protein